MSKSQNKNSTDERADIPDDPWNGEVFRRMQAGEDEESVRIEVVCRYLDAGDVRPLVDSIDRGRPIPAAILRRVAAMLDERYSHIVNEPIKWKIVVEGASSKKRGRPTTITKSEILVMGLLSRGIEDIANGRQPDANFLNCLTLGFRHASEIRASHVPIPKNFPMAFKTERVDGKRGGVPKAYKHEQELRLVWEVAQAIKHTRTLDKALRNVAEANLVSFETIRAVWHKSLK